MVKNYFSSLLVLLFAALMEGAVLSNITILPAVPDLVLICLIYISINNGKLFGEISGFFGGLFLDFISASPFGLNCLIRTILGFLGGLFQKTMNTDGILIPCILGFIATIIKAVLLWIVSILFPSTVTKYNPFSLLFLFELGMNAILTPLIFKLLRMFDKVLLVKKEA